MSRFSVPLNKITVWLLFWRNLWVRLRCPTGSLPSVTIDSPASLSPLGSFRFLFDLRPGDSCDCSTTHFLLVTSFWLGRWPCCLPCCPHLSEPGPGAIVESGHNVSLSKVSTVSWSQELRQEPWKGVTTGWLLIAYSACFSIAPRTTSQSGTTHGELGPHFNHR